MIEDLEAKKAQAQKETAKGIKNIEDFKKANPLEVLKKKYEAASPEEKAIHDEIKAKALKYINKGDLEGAKKYLAHARTTL